MTRKSPRAALWLALPVLVVGLTGCLAGCKVGSPPVEPATGPLPPPDPAKIKSLPTSVSPGKVTPPGESKPDSR